MRIASREEYPSLSYCCYPRDFLRDPTSEALITPSLCVFVSLAVLNNGLNIRRQVGGLFQFAGHFDRRLAHMDTQPLNYICFKFNTFWHNITF